MAIIFSNPKDREAFEKRKFLEKTIGKISDREAVLLRNLLNPHLENRLSHIQIVNIKEGLIYSLYTEENVLEMVEENLLTIKSILLPDESLKWLDNNARTQFTCLSILKEISEYEGQINSYGNTILDHIQSYFDSMAYSYNTQPIQPKSTQFQFVQPQFVQPQFVQPQFVQPQFVQPQFVQPQFVQLQIQQLNGRQYLTLDEKVEVLEKVKLIYDQIMNSDNYSKWLKVGDEHQIQWTRNYLQESNLYLGIIIDQEDSMLVRDIILTSLDLVKYSSGLIGTGEYIPSPERTLFVDKMKRAWSQQKYRDAGKTKKPYHLPLTKNTKDRLEKMAQVKGLSETAMLDILINISYEIEYVDIDGKDIY